jgi:hypothetical protein
MFREGSALIPYIGPEFVDVLMKYTPAKEPRLQESQSSSSLPHPVENGMIRQTLFRAVYANLKSAAVHAVSPLPWRIRKIEDL